MNSKWVEEYRRISLKTQFLSKLGTFLLSLLVILSLYDIARYFYDYPSELNRFFEIHLLFTAVIFQFVVFVIFSLRFVLSFFKSKKVFFINQIFWLIGVLTLIIYWYISIPDPIPFGIYSTYPDPTFSYSSQVFSGLGMYYLILSPLRQITTIIIALVKSK